MDENTEIELTDEQMQMSEKLTPLQVRFVINVVSGMSQRQAYVKAGGTAKMETSQDSISSRMLSDGKVDAFYRSLLKTAASNAVMTKQQALQRLTKTAKVVITDVCDFRNVLIGEDEDGHPIYQTVWTLKNSGNIDPDVAAAIKSVKSTKEGLVIELFDHNGAIKQLSAMQGWNAAKEVTANLTIEKVTREIID